MLDVIRFAFDILAFTSVMVLIVLGLGVIASMMGIFNFAHGELVLLGAYTVFAVQEAGVNIWVGIIAAPIIVGVFGVLLERTIIRHFYAAPIIAMLGTYAIGLIIREIVRGLLGAYPSVPEPWPGSWSALGLDFSIWRTFIIVTTLR
jgi:branched-chain amino acid transport system permease protein